MTIKRGKATAMGKLFFLRVILYSVPLGCMSLFSWNSCGSNILAAGTMTQVEGVLTKVENTRTPPYSKGGAYIEVEYQYAYGKKNYVGRNMTFCTSFASRSIVFDRFSEMYDELLPKVGANVMIWVEPGNPENSVLYKYVPRNAILIFCFILLFGYFGLRKIDQFLMKLFISRASSTPG